jgi:hypothetical protein
MATQTIDTYRLTRLEEPSDEILAQLMHEAAEDASRSNREATIRFFEKMLQDAKAITSAWQIMHTNPFFVLP